MPALKQLLTAGNALLQPPAPLPSSPPDLVERLRQSAAQLPEWHQRPGWTEDDQLDEIGDDDPGADAARRKHRRDALVLLVGLRCMDLLNAMQEILCKEFWPVDQRDGLEAKDFLLGTADLRLVRLMLAHTVSSALLQLTSAYVVGLPQRAPIDPRLLLLLSSLIKLIEPPQPPTGASTNNPHLPPTSITQTVVTSHLTPITIAAVIVGWTPTAPPATYALVRTELLRAYETLPPTQAMASLGTALKMVQEGKKKKPHRGWIKPWPGYVDSSLGVLMSGQVQRPGGVQAVMENVLGEAGNMTGPEAVDGPKLDQIAGVLSRVPRNVPPDVYIPQLLTTLFELITPGSTVHPLSYIHTAAYVVHHLWSTNPIAVEWLKAKLHSLWLPQTPELGVVATADAVQAATSTMALLITHSPPSPDFVDFIIHPILTPLFALHASLSSSPTAKSIEKRPEAGLLPDEVKMLLTSWGKVVYRDDGVKGVWEIITSGKGWPTSNQGEELFWRRSGAGAELVYGYHDAPMDVDITTHAEDDESNLLDQFDLAPSPPVLAALLKEWERQDISSETFLKVLNEWRVRVSADEGDPVPALLFLRLTLAMMDAMGDKLLSNPEQVLSFVEGVLNDEAQTLAAKTKPAEEKKPLIEVVDKKPLIEMLDSTPAEPRGPLIEEMDQDDNELPELTEEGVQKMGMTETAISLLLASLEANEKLNHASAAILHPISDHLEVLMNSPSSAIRTLAREATLVLLMRRSAALTSEDGQVSPAVATYRRALKLVSDEIHPVRGHGLVLLRDLVLSKDYDPALTASILDVYMNSILDKDSYIYLNAVKGLAAMADALGKDVFRMLVREYRSTNEFSGDQLDRALRVGEALDMIIRRAGKTFSANVEYVVPSLLETFPNTTLPTVLRTSALSLLSTCAEVDHLALLPWSNDLTNAAIDLIQVETVTDTTRVPQQATDQEPEAEAEPKLKPKPKVVLIDDEEPEDEPPAPNELEKPRIIDEEPTKQDSKHPALRRAAVVFLGLLFASIIEADTDEATQRSSDEFQMRLPGAPLPPRVRARAPLGARAGGSAGAAPSFGLSPRVLERAGVILRYVAFTDVDEVVRGQAGEVMALAERLKTVRVAQEIGARTLLP